jgi:hypothetical protein
MKIIFQNIKNLMLLLLILIISGCTETLNLQTDTYKEALVVEATITNELKKQEIKITKTSQFEDNEIKPETGAIVIVHDDKGNVYPFQEVDGKYISQTEFKAEPNTQYGLDIFTKEGKNYKSSNEVLTSESQIQSITPKVVVDKDNGRGVQIKVQSYDPTNSSKYYRYEYEETYKIIAPKWLSYKLVITGERTVGFVSNSADTRTCYSTKNSPEIIQTNTAGLQEDRVDYQVRFISDQNYIISHRYSILVRQYVQSLEAYTFYKTLKEVSSSSSILSPKQPGLIFGNIKCVNDADAMVIGFFDVSTVSSQRIFFNYEDLFPGEPIPPYYVDCTPTFYNFCFGLAKPPCQGTTLISLLNNDLVFYDPEPGSSYDVVPIECGDCTKFSSKEIPSFWTN